MKKTLTALLMALTLLVTSGGVSFAQDLSDTNAIWGMSDNILGVQRPPKQVLNVWSLMQSIF